MTGSTPARVVGLKSSPTLPIPSKALDQSLLLETVASLEPLLQPTWICVIQLPPSSTIVLLSAARVDDFSRGLIWYAFVYKLKAIDFHVNQSGPIPLAEIFLNTLIPVTSYTWTPSLSVTSGIITFIWLLVSDCAIVYSFK